MAQILDLGKIRFNWAGNYSSSTEYEYNDLVKYGPNLYAYTASSAGTNIVPTTTANWTLVTEGVAYRGPYAASTLYYKNDIVTDGISTYIVITQHTSLDPATTSSNGNIQLIALGQEGLPSQAGNIDKVLTTNASTPSWTATTKLTKGYWGTTQGGAAVDFESNAVLTDVASVFARSSADFAQLVMVNPSNGSNASADVIVYTADGTNDSGWIDLGITSNDFSAETFGITGPHDGYIFMSAPRINEKSVTKVRVVGTTATLTTATAHGYFVGEVVKLENIGEDGDFYYLPNGLYTLTAVSSSTFSFSVADLNITPFNEEDLPSPGNAYAPLGDGNLVFATDKTGLTNAIVFAAGGFDSGTTQMTIYPDQNVHIEIATTSTSPTTGALTVVGGIGSQGNIYADGIIDNNDIVNFGFGSTALRTAREFTNAAAVFNFDNGSEDDLFAQIAFHNADPTSSTDIIVYPNNGYDEYGWASFGVTGSDFGDPLFPLTGANDAYIFYDAPVEETATITSKALTNNVATLTVDGTMPETVKPGAKAEITGVDATFNGTYFITSVTSSTFSYAVTAANVVNTAISPTGSVTFNGGAQGNLVFATGENGTDNKIIFAAGGFATGNTQMEITPDLNVHIEIPTASTSPTTGALTVVGGVGIQGDLNIAGNVQFGGTGTQISTANLAVTAPFVFTGDNSTVSTNDLGLVVEGKVPVAVPARTVINKSLTSNVATITTSVDHLFIVGDSVSVTGVDSTFNGTHPITAVTDDTFSFAVTASDVSSTPVGNIDAFINNKALTSNVATLTTVSAHTYLVGETVVITGVDSTFNGTYTITEVTSNTFSYAKTASNVLSTPVSPVGSAAVNRSTATATVAAGSRTRYSAFSKDATDQIWKLVSNISAEPTTTINYAQDTYGAGVDVVYDSLKLGGLDATGNIVTSGNISSTGNITVNTDKFTVDASTGNTAVSGTLAVSGNTTLTGDIAVNGGDITTNQVTFGLVDTTATTVNFARAATGLNMGATSGTTTVRNDLAVTGGLAVNTDKFTVAAATGNSSIAGTLGVTGNITASADLTVTGTTTFNGAVNLNNTSRITGRFDVQEMREDIATASITSNVMTLSYTAANVFYNGTGPSANYTINVQNVPTDNDKTMAISVIQVQGGTGYIPSAFQIGGSAVTIKWGGGTAPTATSSSGKIDIFNFTLLRVGNAWQVLGSANLNF